MRLGFLEQKDIAELISNEVRDLILFFGADFFFDFFPVFGFWDWRTTFSIAKGLTAEATEGSAE